MNQKNRLTNLSRDDKGLDMDAIFLTGNLKKDITAVLIKYKVVNQESVGNLTLHINCGAISRIINGLELK